MLVALSVKTPNAYVMYCQYPQKTSTLNDAIFQCMLHPATQLNQELTRMQDSMTLYNPLVDYRFLTVLIKKQCMTTKIAEQQACIPNIDWLLRIMIYE